MCVCMRERARERETETQRERERERERAGGGREGGREAAALGEINRRGRDRPEDDLMEAGTGDPLYPTSGTNTEGVGESHRLGEAGGENWGVEREVHQ